MKERQATEVLRSNQADALQVTDEHKLLAVLGVREPYQLLATLTYIICYTFAIR